jgi:DNA-binding transcriptional LysR family regulator
VVGRIRLGVMPTVAGYFLAPFLERFRRVHPDIDVSVTELGPDEIERQLADEDLDFAIALASTLGNAQALVRTILFASSRRLWVAPSHRLASRRRIRLADVAAENYLLLTIDDNEATTRGYWRRNGLQPSVGFRTASIEAVRNMVASGAGVTILSDLVYRPFSLEGDRIVARKLVDPVPDLELALCWKRRRRLSDAGALFRDSAAEHRPRLSA